MNTFVEAYEADQSPWVKEVNEMSELKAEISQFWKNYSERRDQQKENSTSEKTQT
jgi:hypothetical protein